jgi:hypothetical protein
MSYRYIRSFNLLSIKQHRRAGIKENVKHHTKMMLLMAWGFNMPQICYRTQYKYLVNTLLALKYNIKLPEASCF